MKVFYRLYQITFRIASYIFRWRKPELLTGKNSLLDLPTFIKRKQIDHVLIITDETIHSLGLMDGLLRGLDNVGIHYVVYSGTVPNPTIQNIVPEILLGHGQRSR